MYKAAIIGGTGYGGAELCRQLLQHPEVSLERVSSVDHVGERLGAVHLNLEGVTELVFEELPATEAARDMDVVFLGLPHTVSSEVVGELRDSEAAIIDLSGDFRLRDLATYERYYKTTHPCPELIETFVYGLPELNREALRSARRVASPGCFATLTALGLMPLARAGLLAAPARTVAMTGSSGSGAYAKAGTHHPTRAGNLKAYSPMHHRHQPEIEQTLFSAGARDGFALDFVPVSAPLTRGMMATTLVDVPAATTSEDVAALLRDTFEGHPFIKVLTDRLPEVVAVKGTNYVEVGAQLGAPRGAVRPLALLTALDNLVKGGAGQAVQGMNLCLGLPETAGLVRDFGIWP